MEEQRDEHLWEIAKRRAKFQDSLIRYLVVMMILWGIWWLTDDRQHDRNHTPWPAWPMLFIVISLVVNYIKAYKTDDMTTTEKEYEKLKRKNN